MILKSPDVSSNYIILLLQETFLIITLAISGRSNFTNCDCITDGVSTAKRTKCEDDCGYHQYKLLLRNNLFYRISTIPYLTRTVRRSVCMSPT